MEVAALQPQGLIALPQLAPAVQVVPMALAWYGEASSPEAP